MLTGKVILWIFICFIIQNPYYLNPAISCPIAEGNEVRLSKGDSGREITVKVGDVLHIELESFGGTGYEWYFDKPIEEYFEIIRDYTEEVSAKGIVGAPVKRTWELRAVKKGETEVTLYLYRVWEGKDKTVDFFKIKVNIL